MTEAEWAQHDFKHGTSEEVRDLLTSDVPGGMRNAYFVDSASPPGDLLATPKDVGPEFFRLSLGEIQKKAERFSELLARRIRITEQELRQSGNVMVQVFPEPSESSPSSDSSNPEM
jgi:hypothetical protein